MKKIISVIILLLLAAGCNEKDKVEVIKLNDNNYIPVSEVDSSGKVISQNLNTSINEQIEKKISEGEIDESQFKTYNFLLYINKSGKIDKIVVMNAPDEKIADFMIKAFPEQEFKAATKDGKPVKYKFGWRYSGKYKITADPMPEPVGGIEAIQSNINYPEIARRAGIQGKVFVQAYINENGDVINTKVLKGIGAGCDEAAENAVKKAKFKPGMVSGVPVKVQVVVPVVFKLSDK